MNAWLRGLACSLVKPCPIMSLSQNGFGERSVSSDFSVRAGFLRFRVFRLEYWSGWHPPHVPVPKRVTGRLLSSFRCSAAPSWQFTQLLLACFPPSFSAWIASWHSKHCFWSTGRSVPLAAAGRALTVIGP